MCSFRTAANTDKSLKEEIRDYMLQYIQAFKGVYVTVLIILGILLYFTAFFNCLIFPIV